MTRHPTAGILLAATLLAACGGGDGTGPDNTPVVTTIQVNAVGAVLVGDTTVVTATVKDQFGATMAGQTVTWSLTLNGGGASITPAGVLTSTAAGTAIVTATVEGKTGTANVVMGTDDRFGYAWADQSAAATYTPDAGYTHNSSGGGITITRSGTGAYAVTFAGLAASGAQRTAVQVSAYSTGSAHCKASGWQSSGADLVVNVRCFALAGAPSDARYTVLVAGATSLGGRLGFAYADNATASAVPAQARASRGKGVRVTRSGTGAYTVTFDGLVRGGTDTQEQTMVTAVGDGAERCTIGGWDYSVFSVDVRCYNSAGALADSRFSILVIEKGRPGKKLAFAWANDPASASYTPSLGYSVNDGGGAITITHATTGNYLVTFTGLARTVGATETVLIAAYGSSAMCRIGSWSAGFSVSAVCYDTAGNPVDSRFDIIVVQ